MRQLNDFKRRRQYFQLKDKRLSQNEKYMMWHLRRYFNAQRDRLLKRLPTGIEGTKGIAGDIFNKEAEKRKLIRTISPVLKQVLTEEGQATAERFDNDFSVTSKVDYFIQNRANNMAGDVTDTTFKNIKEEVQEGYAQGESSQQIGKRITDRYEQIKTGRAENIARTETHTATTKGNLEGYKQSGVEKKTWVAVLDSRTRANHRLMDGETVGISQTFPNGLKYPGDPSGSAAQVVNCRCQI